MVLLQLGVRLVGVWWRSLKFTRRDKVFASVIAVLTLFSLTQINYGCDWTGFGVCQFPTGLENGYRSEKTLWDWLGLLIVPAVLASGAVYFNRAERQNELRIAEQRAQDVLLQTYLDQMRELLLDRKLRDSKAGDEVRHVAQTQTLIVLRRLDRERRTILMQFLWASQLVGTDEAQMIVDFRGVDLSHADLSGTPISAISLQKANLREANLAAADLVGADLTEADLYKVNFLAANLHRAKFKDAFLYKAKLQGANLKEANLVGADLTEADLMLTDLTGTDFQRADLTGASLRAVNDLEGAMPKAILFPGKLTKINLREVKLSEIDFRGVNLEGANLTNAKLPGAKLQGANLKEAVLRWTDLTGADLQRADLTGASLHGANLKDAIVTQQQLERAASLEDVVMPDGS